MKTLFVFGMAVATALTVAGTANAQCAFQHPRRAKEIVLPLVQAYVPCNANPECVADGLSRTPNAFTEIGVGACQPPQTYNEYAGSPANGWLWGPKAYGSVTFKAIANKVDSPLNPSNSADVAVRLELFDVWSATGPVTGSGRLTPVRRTTFQDRTYGDMTVIDLRFPGFPVHVENGRAKLKTTANVWLNRSGFAAAPGCTALELVALEVRDENDSLFATPGILLPSVP